MINKCIYKNPSYDVNKNRTYLEKRKLDEKDL